MARRSTRKRERCDRCGESLSAKHRATAEQRLLLAIFNRPAHVCRFCADTMCDEVATAQGLRVGSFRSS